jgi:hypothetical protein
MDTVLHKETVIKAAIKWCRGFLYWRLQTIYIFDLLQRVLREDHKSCSDILKKGIICQLLESFWVEVEGPQGESLGYLKCVAPLPTYLGTLPCIAFELTNLKFTSPH